MFASILSSEFEVYVALKLEALVWVDSPHLPQLGCDLLVDHVLVLVLTAQFLHFHQEEQALVHFLNHCKYKTACKVKNPFTTALLLLITAFYNEKLQRPEY